LSKRRRDRSAVGRVLAGHTTDPSVAVPCAPPRSSPTSCRASKPAIRGMFFLDAAPGGRLVPHDRGRGLLKVLPTGLIEGSSMTLDVIRKEVAAALGKGL
jgi:hypothetical protein